MFFIVAIALQVKAETFDIACAGNSLTRHAILAGVWDWESGMAATDETLDYAHALRDKVAAISPLVTTLSTLPAIQVADATNILTTTTNLYDLLVLQTGENDLFDATFQSDFADALTLAEARLKAGGLVIATGDWYDNGGKVSWQKSTVEAKGDPFLFVDLSVLKVAATFGYGGPYSDAGVATHPNNRGHSDIAVRIFGAWINTQVIPKPRYGVGIR